MALQTKTISANGSKGHHKFTLAVSEESTIISSNSSPMKITLKMSPIQTGWDWNGFSGKIKYKITVNGEEKEGNLPTVYDGKSTITIVEYTQDVEHDSNGKKTIDISFSISDSSGQNYTPGTVDASKAKATMTLTTIARASAIGVLDANIGSDTLLTINKADDNFLTSIYYKATGQSNWNLIVEKTKEKSYAWKVPTSFYSLIPDDPEIECQFKAITYSKDEEDNDVEVGSKETTATFKAVDKPVINSKNAIDVNSATTALTKDSSKVVKYASTIKITVDATSSTGASIKKITVNGITATDGIVTINKATTNKFEIIVVDSRGNTKEDSITLSLIDYVPLSLNGNVVRNQPTDGKVKINYNGNYFKGNFSSSVANTLQVFYRYREKNGTFSEWVSLSPTIATNTYSQVDYIISTFDYQKQYEFELKAVDLIDEKSVTGIVVSKGIPIINWNGDKVSIHGNLIVDSEITGVASRAKNAIHAYNYAIGSVGSNTRYYRAFARTSNNNTVGNINATFIVSQVGNFGGKCQGSWLVQISNRGSTPTMKVKCLMKPDSGEPEFGYYSSGDYFYFGVYLPVYAGVGDIVIIGNIGVDFKTWYYSSTTAPSDWTPATTEKIKAGVILFDNESGSNGSIQLNDSVANYSFIEIYYHDNNGNESSGHPFVNINNKAISLDLQQISSTTTAYWRSTTYQVSGKTITVSSTNQLGYIKYDNGSMNLAYDKNYIYITKIIGYKE